MYQIYGYALDSLLSFDYEKASLEFEEVERQHPYSEWAKKAIIMSAYSSYKNRDYLKAEANDSATGLGMEIEKDLLQEMPFLNITFKIEKDFEPSIGCSIKWK